MKINEIDLNLLSDDDLKKLLHKYKIVEEMKLSSVTREESLRYIRKYILDKMNKYKSRPRSFSQPNIMNPINKTNEVKTVNDIIVRDRRMSSPNIKIHKSDTDPPKSDIQYQRDRRMSMPTTQNEIMIAKEDHQNKRLQHTSNANVNVQSSSKNYDEIGLYPPVRRLIAIGDLHGDLNVTLKALRLAKVIPDNIFQHNVNDISWCGGDTWLIQLGDQIDRCRPDDWEKNCIKDYDDVVEDEGNNMRIIQIFQKLDVEAKKCGGRVLGLLGNHELMNVDKDYRYVSPEEFLEFVPPEQRKKGAQTDDGYPLGYYHRLKAFERGGNIAKHYAVQKKSIIQIGRWLFIHGGIGHALASKYTIQEMNTIVTDWLLNKKDEMTEKNFNELFRDDDDISPFWCRLYSEEDDYDENTLEGFEKLLNILNKRNNTLNPIECVVLAHTPQFMSDRYLNSIYNERLWRIDVGMSRAFGKHDSCGENKYRQIQLLEVINDKKCVIHKAPFHGRQPAPGMGDNATFDDPTFLR
jgi:hypothetical protein